MNRRFHFWMLAVNLALCALCLAGLRRADIDAANFLLRLHGLAVLGATCVVLCGFAAALGWNYGVDCLLTVYWAVVGQSLLLCLTAVAARSPMPLQDAALARVDALLGVHVAAFSTWMLRTAVGARLAGTYDWLEPLMRFAIVVPLLAGRARAVRRLLVANMVAFAVALPLFALVPAVGPWYLLHAPNGAEQVFCQHALELYRAPGTVPLVFAPWISFPSFHVIWAVLCGRALWSVRLLRVPAVAVSAAVALSTLVTGWHYAADVLGGAALAWASIAVAERLLREEPVIVAESEYEYALEAAA